MTAPTRDGADIKVVLFDLDGTLVDTIELILASFRFATGEVLGEPLSDEALLRDVGMPLQMQMSSFSEAHADELVRVYREHNAAHHDALASEYPGTREALDTIAAMGYPMGVVTSKLSSVARRGLDLFDLAGYFEVLVAADDVQRHKPDPYPLRHAADLLGTTPEACVYVGDSPHDMSSAVAAGAVPIAALWGPFPTERVLQPGPAYALSSIAELPAVLDGRGEHLRVERETTRRARSTSEGSGVPDSPTGTLAENDSV